MTRRDDVRTTRRVKISPERAGLPVYGGNRRVPGLRREDVALLAGISTTTSTPDQAPALTSDIDT